MNIEIEIRITWINLKQIQCSAVIKARLLLTSQYLTSMRQGLGNIYAIFIITHYVLKSDQLSRRDLVVKSHNRREHLSPRLMTSIIFPIDDSRSYNHHSISPLEICVAQLQLRIDTNCMSRWRSTATISVSAKRWHTSTTTSSESFLMRCGSGFLDEAEEEPDHLHATFQQSDR